MRDDSYRLNEIAGPFLGGFVRRAARAFSVSEEFLRSSECDTYRENTAYLLAYAFDECQQDRMTVGARADYLIDMRRSAGYATLEDASAEFGLNPLHAYAHERGLRPMTAEQLAAYALVYGKDPINAIYAQADFGTAPHWWRRRAVGDFLSGRWDFK